MEFVSNAMNGKWLANHAILNEQFGLGGMLFPFYFEWVAAREIQSKYFKGLDVNDDS